MKQWDKFIEDSTNKLGGSAVPKPKPESAGSALEKMRVNPKTNSELYKNASPYMQKLAAEADEAMNPE
jgi:hypothetical protein